MTPTLRRLTQLSAIATIGIGTGACASSVDQQTYEGDLQQLREELRAEIRTGDEQVADRANTRIDSLGSELRDFTRDLRVLEEDFNAKINSLEAKVALDVPVHFEFDKAEIRQVDQPALDRFARVIDENRPDALITIEGFADPAGPQSYNLWLGEQRAKAVKSYLVERGLDANRLRVASYGEARERQVRPGVGGPGEEGMPNRRVSFVIEFVQPTGLASGGGS